MAPAFMPKAFEAISPESRSAPRQTCERIRQYRSTGPVTQPNG